MYGQAEVTRIFPSAVHLQATAIPIWALVLKRNGRWVLFQP